MGATLFSAGFALFNILMVQKILVVCVRGCDAVSTMGLMSDMLLPPLKVMVRVVYLLICCEGVVIFALHTKSNQDQNTRSR